MSEHRWSGWPGAWCLDCGIEDAREICVGVHSEGLICIDGHYVCEQSHPLRECAEHTNPSCLESGSNRHNPYTHSE